MARPATVSSLWFADLASMRRSAVTSRTESAPGAGGGRITRHSVPFASIEPAEYALEVAFAGRAPAPARDHVKLAPWRR